jgi:hypothetical protein
MADILITDLTDGSLDINNDWSGTGVFDKLIEAVNKNIEGQYNKGRISGSDYANVYLGSMQSVLAQSMEFLLREKLVEAQIQDTEASVALKENQLEVDKALAEAQLEQQWGYEVTRDGDNNLVLGDTTGAGKIDKEKIVLDEQKETSDIEQALLDYELASTKPAQLADILKTTDVKERQMVEAELTGAKQRTLLDTEEQAKQYEVDNILPEQLTKIQEEIDLLQTQDSEMVSNGLKQREKLEEEIDLLQTQDSELAANGLKDRALKDEQVTVTQLEQTALVAKISNDVGTLIDDEGNITYSNDPDTEHYWKIKLMEKELGKADNESALTAAKVDEAEANKQLVIGKLLQEYGMTANVESYTCYDSAGSSLGPFDAGSEPAETSYKVPYKYNFTMEGVSFSPTSVDDYSTKAPTTLLEAGLMKSATERDVAVNTAKGFAADTNYKTYRSLQELLFALANAGLITDASSSDDAYSKIVTSMEKAMNKQAEVWGTNPYVDLNANNSNET